MKAKTDPIYSIFTEHNYSAAAVQCVYEVAPGKLAAVLGIAPSKVARLILNVGNVTYEESVKDLVLVTCRKIRLNLW